MVYMWCLHKAHPAPIRTMGNVPKVRSDIPISLFMFVSGKKASIGWVLGRVEEAGYDPCNSKRSSRSRKLE